jgi:cytochrome c oxidase assembly protein subunit 15
MNKKLSRFSFALVIYTVLVILWGAWVRISKSGNGCGDSWPFCHGEVLPSTAAAIHTWIEFSHRLSTGLFGMWVVAIFIWVWKVYPRGHILRKASGCALFFTISEALIGALLVKAGLVTDNASFYRLSVMCIHLINSVLLTASITAVWVLSKKDHQRFHTLNLKWPRYLTIGLFLIIATGGIAALSTTLFPSLALWEGLNEDFQAGSHYLLRYRILHPVLATAIGGGAIYALILWYQKLQNPELKKTLRDFIFCLSFALLFGFATLLNLSPVWMKLVHLSVAHILMILWVRFWLTLKLEN